MQGNRGKMPDARFTPCSPRLNSSPKSRLPASATPSPKNGSSLWITPARTKRGGENRSRVVFLIIGFSIQKKNFFRPYPFILYLSFFDPSEGLWITQVPAQPDNAVYLVPTREHENERKRFGHRRNPKSYFLIIKRATPHHRALPTTGSNCGFAQSNFIRYRENNYGV
ncbi:MAG: hypothetical protein ACRESZ_02825 [Methylococcales bacterium]